VRLPLQIQWRAASLPPDVYLDNVTGGLHPSYIQT